MKFKLPFKAKARIRFFRHYFSVPMLLLMIGEGLILVGSYSTGVWLRLGSAAAIEAFSRIEPYVYALLLIFALTSQGLYGIQQRTTPQGMITRICLSFAVGVGLIMAITYLYPSHAVAIGRGILLYAHGIAFGLITLVHLGFFKLVEATRFKSRVLVVGAGEKAATLLQLKRKTDLRMLTLSGFIPCAGDSVTVDARKRIAIAPDELLGYVRKTGISEIIVAPDKPRHAFPTQPLLDCKMSGIRVLDLCTFFERESGKIRLDLLRPSWLIFGEGFDQNSNRWLPKRLFDLSFALLLLTVALPIMLLTALAIFLESRGRGSIFYYQTRVGLGGRPFRILKFRSMVSNAEAAGQVQWAQPDDQRITRVGRVIRKYRIDELPQLLNVLLGQMSLVGPRPERPEFVERLCESVPYYNERHRVKPGLTGWAQLKYPYGASIQDAFEKLQYDLYYVKNNTLFLDFYIVLQTVEVVLFNKGAR